MIADQLQGDGFKYLKSGPTLKRRQGDITQEIHFGSSHYNVAGRYIALEIAGSVASLTLGRWRRAHPSNLVRRDGPYASWIVAGNIGNLTTDHRYMTWNLADSATRRDCIDDAVASIHRIILPFFALFDDPARGIETLIHIDMGSVSVLEYILSTLGKEAAEKYGHRVLLRNPYYLERFKTDFAEFARFPPRYKQHGHFATDFAALAAETDLDLTKGD